MCRLCKIQYIPNTLSYKSKKYRVIAQNILYRRYVKTETACFSNCAEKLYLVGGELPLLFVLVTWQHHEEIITKCNSMDEALFYVGEIIKQGLLCSV